MSGRPGERRFRGRPWAAWTICAGAAAGALLVSGCVSEPSRFESDPNYQIGYADGCATGTTYEPGFRKTMTRNEQRFDQNEAYRAGWRTGFHICGRGEGPGERPSDFLTNERPQSGSQSIRF